MNDFTLGSEIIENKLNPNTYHYSTTHKKNISPGDLFEINAYENLLLWAKNDDNISWVCSKNRKNKVFKDGLGSNQTGQIVYFVDHLSLAEFDMLFSYKDSLINIEATTSLNSKNLYNYFKKIDKNHYILKKLFSTSKIHTVFLLVKEPDENITFPPNTSYVVVENSFSTLDMSNGLPPKIDRPTNKMFHKKTAPINYFKLLDSFQFNIFTSFFFNDRENTIKLFKANLFFERSFLGGVKRSKISCDLIPVDVKTIYVCFNKDLSLSLFYIHNKKTFELTLEKYGLSLDLKKARFSRSRKMLLYILKNKKMKYLSSSRFDKVISFDPDGLFPLITY